MLDYNMTDKSTQTDIYEIPEVIWDKSLGYSTIKEAHISIEKEKLGKMEYIIQFIDNKNSYDLLYFLNTPMGRVKLEGRKLIHSHSDNNIGLVLSDYELKEDESHIDFNFFEWNADDWN